MKQPLTGISLTLFRAWCYGIPFLCGLFAILMTVVNIRLRTFGYMAVFGMIIDINSTVFFTVLIRKRIQIIVTLERIVVGFLQATFVCVLVEVALFMARHYMPDIPAPIYVIGPVLVALATPLFALDKKSTFGWFKFKGIA